MNAIPTVYKGTRFRSRLEARWAAFFDICRWSWDYEPIDLSGYIPDFIMSFARPLLVEVKPLLWDRSTNETILIETTKTKIRSSGWTGQVLLVGARLDSNRLGLLSPAWTFATRDEVATGTYNNSSQDFRTAGNVTQWSPPTAAYTHVCQCGQPAIHKVDKASSWLCDRCMEGVDAAWRARQSF